MADIGKEIGDVARAIQGFEPKTSSDIRRMHEMCRVLAVDVADLYDVAEHSIRSVLVAYDGGRSRRALKVTRPLRQSRALITAAARRTVGGWNAYRREFAEDMKPASRKKFDPKK